MKIYSLSIKEQFKRIDYAVIVCAVFMSSLSLITLAGSADTFGWRRFTVQAIATLLGIAIMLVIAFVDYNFVVNKLSIPFFAISLILMAVVFVFGQSEGGTQNNWIKLPGIPFYLQPSEFVKPMFIVTFSKHVDLVKKKINHPKNVAALCAHGGIIIAAVLSTGDLGSALVFIAIFCSILFVGGLSLWYFAGALLLIVIAAPYVWPRLATYQQMRILCGFNPELDPEKYGYQAIKSRIAIAAGGFRGAGFSGGTKYQNIPYAHSDFLFAVLAEKFGFIGCFMYIAASCTMIFLIIRKARNVRKDYGSFICIGVVAILIAQTLENIGMCLAMLPVIGITLPFFSYGGSSVISMYICMGMIQSVSTHNKKYYFKREDF